VRIPCPKAITYLALEGGGGKGVTYLGAMKALRELKVLPIRHGCENQLKGISGASAGAITALMLTLGFSDDDVQKELSNPRVFEDFFECPPRPGVSRLVDRSSRAGIRIRGRESISYKVEAALDAGAMLLTNWLAYNEVEIENPILKRLAKHPSEYAQCLLLDQGLFSGLQPRSYFADVIQRGLGRRALSAKSTTAMQVNFRTLRELTGIDLVITGTSITKRCPGIFSARTTPLFPVVDAVGLSMSIPLLFKPVHVEVGAGTDAISKDRNWCQGDWLDGGILNNLPLHAFDKQPSASTAQPSQWLSLHPGVLGLRLTPPPRQPAVKPSLTGDLVTFFGDLFETILYPSEEGQIRSSTERDQTIDLCTYDLETTEFTPSEAKRKKPIDDAYQAVRQYFRL
jgi:predicted acylesterase/phospholipase RssA